MLTPKDEWLKRHHVWRVGEGGRVGNFTRSSGHSLGEYGRLGVGGGR